MGFPWGIFVSFFVLLVAYLVNKVLKPWIEEDSKTYLVVGGFLLLYVIAAGLVVYLTPSIGNQASVASIYDTLSTSDTGF